MFYIILAVFQAYSCGSDTIGKKLQVSKSNELNIWYIVHGILPLNEKISQKIYYQLVSEVSGKNNIRLKDFNLDFAIHLYEKYQAFLCTVSLTLVLARYLSYWDFSRRSYTLTKGHKTPLSWGHFHLQSPWSCLWSRSQLPQVEVSNQMLTFPWHNVSILRNKNKAAVQWDIY